MGKYLKKTFRFFIPTWGNIMWWLIIVLATFFNGKDWLDDVKNISLAIVICLLVVFVLQVMMGKISWLEERIGTSPKIEVTGCYSDERVILYPVESQFMAGTVSTAYTNSVITGSPSGLLNTQTRQDFRETFYNFVHVVFENKTRKWIFSTATAYQVTAYVRFLDENENKLLDEFIGRWGNAINQPTRQSVITSPEFTSINMRSDGKSKYELNIAMKHRSSEFIVAFNNESYFAPSNNLMLIDRTVKRQKVFVEIVLKADNIDGELSYRFELLNLGVGGGLKIKPIDDSKGRDEKDK
jgi:hypothetical protein